jgi:hypothetical protein
VKLRFIIILGGALDVALIGTASADGTVVAIDSGDLVIDVGKSKGAHEGEEVELWRPVHVRHPVTGHVLSDRFRIGTVRLTQVQSMLSLAKIDGTFLRPPAAGDVVVVPDEGPKEPPPPAKPGKVEAPPAPVQGRAPAAPAAAPPAPARIVPSDPDAQALSDLFVALRGATPAARASAYAAFVAARPQSRFASVLKEEVDALGHRANEPAPYEASAAAIPRLKPGAPQRFAVELDPRFVGAVVHVRPRGAPAYRSLPMQSLGPRYWAATFPADVIARGESTRGVEYFVEGVSSTGAPTMIIGSADAPKDAAVDAPPLTGKERGTLAQLNVQSEYASFNTKKANDYVFQTEGQFGWRLGDTGIRAVRSGFGVLRGKGGSLDELDTRQLGGKDVGLTYGYIESEVGLTPLYALIARPIIGLREGGVAGGAQGFLRIGNDLRTNLLMGGEILGSVGMRGIVELNWRTIPKIPITLRSEVTNQPAGTGGDLGARAIAQAGYEIATDFTVAVRGSYQGRTINHAGPGAGLGVSYQW